MSHPFFRVYKGINAGEDGRGDSKGIVLDSIHQYYHFTGGLLTPHSARLLDVSF
jgi:hypothetical protein